jgi:hypothetical protein
MGWGSGIRDQKKFILGTDPEVNKASDPGFAKNTAPKYWYRWDPKCHICLALKEFKFDSKEDPGSTVGAQSIAPAQSIAHGQIGDSISQKN